jgi:chaperonin cofactor prefoldin
MLLKAIQELSAKNDALEARIATQATQIADLISRVTALENG